MNWLKGKTGEEILLSFLNRHDIPIDTWHEVQKQMKKADKEEAMRDWLWRTPMIIFGLTLLVTLIYSAVKGFSPHVFPKAEVTTFIKAFINIMYTLILYLGAIICIIFPIVNGITPDDK